MLRERTKALACLAIYYPDPDPSGVAWGGPAPRYKGLKWPGAASIKIFRKDFEFLDFGVTAGRTRIFGLQTWPLGFQAFEGTATRCERPWRTASCQRPDRRPGKPRIEGVWQIGDEIIPPF